MWERDTVPTINPQLLAELRAYLERSFQNLEAELQRINETLEDLEARVEALEP